MHKKLFLLVALMPSFLAVSVKGMQSKKQTRGMKNNASFTPGEKKRDLVKVLTSPAVQNEKENAETASASAGSGSGDTSHSQEESQHENKAGVEIHLNEPTTFLSSQTSTEKLVASTPSSLSETGGVDNVTMESPGSSPAGSTLSASSSALTEGITNLTLEKSAVENPENTLAGSGSGKGYPVPDSSGEGDSASTKEGSKPTNKTKKLNNTSPFTQEEVLEYDHKIAFLVSNDEAKQKQIDKLEKQVVDLNKQVHMTATERLGLYTKNVGLEKDGLGYYRANNHTIERHFKECGLTIGKDQMVIYKNPKNSGDPDVYLTDEILHDIIQTRQQIETDTPALRKLGEEVLLQDMFKTLALQSKQLRVLSEEADKRKYKSMQKGGINTLYVLAGAGVVVAATAVYVYQDEIIKRWTDYRT